MGTSVRSDRLFGSFGQCFRQGYRSEKGREPVSDQEREQRYQSQPCQKNQPGAAMLFGGVVDFRGGSIRGGEADTMRGSIPACFDTDHSFLSFIGCSQAEAEGASPFRSPFCGVVRECELRGADDGAGQRKDRDDLPVVRQGALGA